MLEFTFLNPAKNYIKKLKEKPLKRKFKEKIQEIRLDPCNCFDCESKTGDLAGICCCDIKHNGNNYELAYRLEKNEYDESVVIIIMAGTRENFYQQLKQYIN